MSGETSSVLHLEPGLIKKASAVLRAVRHPLRQDFIRFIHSKGKVTVTELYNHFRLQQAVASQQLAILRKAHAVKTKAEGKFRYYSVNYERLAEIDRLAGLLLAPATGK